MVVEDIFVNGASGTLKRLVSVVASEISLAWGVKDELKKLRETMELIDAKTSDADTKQVNNAEVSIWLKRLKDAAYDDDDVLDEFSYEAMRRFEMNSKPIYIPISGFWILTKVFLIVMIPTIKLLLKVKNSRSRC
ncbi:disease resistance protein RGA2-like [Papaver somniferum]|uniref:disease resistance protein RGA2-like n=1 Tax=Papaver somniferum TaxID=3469 RepID=UPI000E701B15|nr:disease resistance protein RGA2-like [Papaver somniferum]